MPVLDRKWSETEIQISDAVQGIYGPLGIPASRIAAIANIYLNEPEKWAIVNEVGPVAQCRFMTKTGDAQWIRLGIATNGNVATVFHYECETTQAELVEPLAALEQEFPVDDEPYEYNPREFRTDRTVKVRFERRGKRAPLKYEGND